jgi:hypothetical protein
MTSRIIALCGHCMLALLFVSSASGQQRTFVSAFGSDGNPCSRAAPCRNFAQAISQTSAGGEVIVLDPAGYGPVTITKPVSIIATPGVYAGISVFSGDGIDINSGASDTVILRGLTVNNQGSNGSGIFFTAGGTLHVEGCVVNGFSNATGIEFNGAGKLEVKDCIIRGNSFGIGLVPPTPDLVVATIDQVRLEGNLNNGLYAREGSTVTISDSIASANGLNGFSAFSAFGGSVQMNLLRCLAFRNVNAGIAADDFSPTASVEVNVDSCVASGNGFGIVARSTSTGISTARVSDSTITDNGTGLLNNGSPAVLLSRTNNSIEGNTINTSGPIGSFTAK